MTISSIRFRLSVCVLPLILPCAPNVFAQADESTAESLEVASESDATPRVSVSPHPMVSLLFEADLDGHNADVSVWRVETSTTITFDASSDWHLSLELGSGFHFYNFGGDIGLGAGEVLDEARSHNVGLTAIYIVDVTWSVISGATLQADYEDGADVGDALTYGVFGAAGYRVSDRLSIQFGAAVRSQLEDNALVLPFIGVQYQLSDLSNLHTKGLGIEYTTQINDELTASIFAQYEFEAFRLADDNPVLPAGVLEDNMIIVGASATWTPTSQFTLTGTIGAAVWHELEFRNDSGDDLGDIETDTSPMLALRASYQF